MDSRAALRRTTNALRFLVVPVLVALTWTACSSPARPAADECLGVWVADDESLHVLSGWRSDSPAPEIEFKRAGEVEVRGLPIGSPDSYAVVDATGTWTLQDNGRIASVKIRLKGVSANPRKSYFEWINGDLAFSIHYDDPDAGEQVWFFRRARSGGRS